MKRFYVVALAAALLCVFASVDAQARNPKKVWQSEEQKIAEDMSRTSMRAWAQYEDFGTMNLEAFAAMEARASLAEQTAVLISRTLERCAESQQEASENGNGAGKDLRSMLADAKQRVKSSAKMIIENSRVMSSSRYQKNKKSNIQICYAVVEISHRDIMMNLKGLKEVEDLLDAMEMEVESPEFQQQLGGAFEEHKEGKLNAYDL